MATTLVVALLALNVAAPLGSCSKSEILSYKGPNYIEGDLIRTPVNEVDLEIPIVFGGTTYNALYVSYAGIISFKDPYSGRFFYNDRSRILETTTLVAPFFTNVDTGTLCWWGSSNATVVSNFRHNILNDTEPLAGYKPKLIFVATWDEEEDGKRTVFQAILSTDGNVSFSKFIYHYLNDSEKDYFIGFNRRDPPRLLTLAVAPEVSLSACQIESFSQWFRIDTLDSNIETSAASCSPMNNDTSSTLPATAHTTFSTQANMSPSTEVILSTTTMIHLSATSSTQYERDVMPSSTTMAHISATPNTPNMTVTPTNSRVAARLMAALFSLFGLIVIVICIVISTLLAVHFIMKSQQLKSMEHKKNIANYFTPAWSSDVNIDHILNSSLKEPCRRPSRTSVITALDVFQNQLESVPEEGRNESVTLSSHKEMVDSPVVGASSNGDMHCTIDPVNNEEQNAVDAAIDIDVVEEQKQLGKGPTEGENNANVTTSSSSDVCFYIDQESNEDSGIGSSHGAVSHNQSFNSFPVHLTDTEETTRMNSNSFTTTDFLSSLGGKDFLHPSERSKSPYISNVDLKVESGVSSYTSLEDLELDDTLWHHSIVCDHSR